MNPKVSIIIPIFNLENFISECVESVISQSLQDWELILVNDGSNDNSLSICLEFSKMDPRIKVIDKTNGGVSAARRSGLLEAKGKYVTYVDGDDLLPFDALEYAYGKLESLNVDVLIGSLQSGISPIVGSRILKEKIYDKESFCYAHSHYLLKMGLHADFFKRESLLQNDVIIDKSIVNNEDYLYMLFMMNNLKNVYTTNKILYKYRIRQGSACHRAFPIDYWYAYFKYLKDNYSNYGVSDNQYYSSKITKLTSLIRNYNYDFDFDDNSLNDLKTVPYYFASNFYQLLTLFFIHTKWNFVVKFMRCHPLHLVNKDRR